MPGSARFLEGVGNMASIAFAIPRREGSEDHSKELVQALTGERGDEVHKRRLQHGFDRIKFWHQDEPRISIVYMEADDLQAAFRNVASDDHEQVKWVSDMIQKITGHHQARCGPARIAPGARLAP